MKVVEVTLAGPCAAGTISEARLGRCLLACAGIRSSWVSQIAMTLGTVYPATV